MAVPALDDGGPHAGRGLRVADGPDVVGGEAGDAVEDIEGAGRRCRDDLELLVAGEVGGAGGCAGGGGVVRERPRREGGDGKRGGGERGDAADGGHGARGLRCARVSGPL